MPIRQERSSPSRGRRSIGRGLGGTARPHRAMGTAFVDASGELRSLGGRRRLADDLAPLSPGMRCQRVLLALRRTRRPRLTEVDQPAAAGGIPFLQNAFGDGQLIHRELGVTLRCVGADRALSGLYVDDDEAARLVAFEPV